MKLICPHCYIELEADEEHYGKIVDCPKCGNEISITEENFIAPPPLPATKICPLCSEEIKFTAKKCKHCGEYLNKTGTQKITVSKSEFQKIHESYPLIANCRFYDPPPTYKQFAYALNLGILPDKKSINSISVDIERARTKGMSAPIYIKEEYKEALYEYIYNRERAELSFFEAHPTCSGCLIIILIALVMIFIFSMCSANDIYKKTENTNVKTRVAQIATTRTIVPQKADYPRKAPVLKIPSDIKYSIANSNTWGNIKRNLDVRINKRVSKEVLRAIALELKKLDSRNYERTFICYWLPGDKIGDGICWATTHFDPNLKVEILGLSQEEFPKLNQPSQARDNEKIIGVWLDEVIRGFEGRITLYKKDNKIFMRKVFKDGSESNEECKMYKLSVQTKIEKIKKVDYYFLIDTDGRLLYKDKDGLIGKCEKIEYKK